MSLPECNAKGRMREPGKMNGTERRYAELLERRRFSGEVLWWKYEAIALRLAEPRCFYHPDFLVLLADGSLEVHETKGEFIREDGWLKLKIAAHTFPFVFRKCVWSKGEWEISVVGRDAQRAEGSGVARGTEASGRDAKRLDAQRSGAQGPGPKDAPEKIKYIGQKIPDGYAIVNGYLEPADAFIEQILRPVRKRTP